MPYVPAPSVFPKRYCDLERVIGDFGRSVLKAIRRVQRRRHVRLHQQREGCADFLS